MQTADKEVQLTVYWTNLSVTDMLVCLVTEFCAQLEDAYDVIYNMYRF